MRIEADSRGPIRRIALRGELDNLNAEAVGPRLLLLAGDPPARVVLDLRDLSLITSAGLGNLIGFVKRVQAAGGHVALARPTLIVRRTTERLGLDEILAVVGSVTEAVRTLGSEAATGASPSDRVVDADRHLLGATGVLFRPEAEDRVPADRRAPPANGRLEGRWADRVTVLWQPSDFGPSEHEFGVPDLEGALGSGARIRLVFRSEGGGRDAFDERYGTIRSSEVRDDGRVLFDVELAEEE